MNVVIYFSLFCWWGGGHLYIVEIAKHKNNSGLEDWGKVLSSGAYRLRSFAW